MIIQKLFRFSPKPSCPWCTGPLGVLALLASPLLLVSGLRAATETGLRLASADGLGPANPFLLTVRPGEGGGILHIRLPSFRIAVIDAPSLVKALCTYGK